MGRWDGAKALFAWDGRWRDLYVLDTTLAEWQQFMQFLASSPYHWAFFVDDQPQALPQDVAWAFQHRDAQRMLLTVDVHGIVLHCHFFWDGEIELDLDPRAVHNEQTLRHLLEFMTALGTALHKHVRLTDENAPDTILFRFDAERGQIVNGS